MVIKTDMEKTILDLVQTEKPFTYSIAQNRLLNPGEKVFIVGITNNVIARPVTIEEIKRLLDLANMLNSNELSIGGWCNGANYYLDIGVIIPSDNLNKACQFAHTFKQLAIWDMEHMKEIIAF